MGKTVTTYLIDGDPKGTQYVFISNKICQMYVIPRSNLSILNERQELQTPAFYILLGEDEATKPKAYIGETENFRERVKDHDSKKAFWQKALLFISKDAAMTKADVQYLEHRAIAEAKTSNTFVLNENKQTPEAPNLPEPEFNQNAAFVWVTFKRTTIQPYNHTPPHPHNPTSSPLNPTTSKDNNRSQKLKTFLSSIGENGANLKLLMEGMHLRDRKSFVNNYINPNLSEGYIAMLYPEIPNHPMQSYYLTKKGRELLEQL